MRADAPSFVPSQVAAVAASGSAGTEDSGVCIGVPSQNGSSGRRRGKRAGRNKNNNDCGGKVNAGSRNRGGGYTASIANVDDTITKPNASTITIANGDNDTLRSSGSATAATCTAADQAKAATNARDRRRMRRRQTNAEKSYATNDKNFPVTNETSVAATDGSDGVNGGANIDTTPSKGASSFIDTKTGTRNDKQKKYDNRKASENRKGRQTRKHQRNKKTAVHTCREKGSQESLNKKGEGRNNAENGQMGSDSPLNDDGAHFPSLGGTIRGAHDSGKDMAQGSSSTMWSQIAAAKEEAEEDRGGDDKLLSEIKAKDLTRLSSGLSAQSSYLRKKKKSGEYSAWSDGEGDDNTDGSNTGGNDDVIGAIQSNAEEQDHVSDGVESSGNGAVLQRSRGLNISRMREKWWAALREKQVKDSQQRAEAARIRGMTRDDAPVADDSSSSCSSVSSWESSSSSSDYCGHLSTNGDANRINRAAPVAQVEVDVSQYLNSPYPLHGAVAKDDVQAVTHLLTFHPIETKRDDAIDADIITKELQVRSQEDDGPARLASFSLVHLSTFLDMPHMLRLLLDSSIVSPALAVDVKDANGVTPLMIACQNGFEASVRVLLGYGPRMAMKEHQLGDSVLHICCRCDGTQPSMLRLLLSSSSRVSSQQRILCTRNKKGQTAMHVACERGRTSIVETFLTEAPAASTKALNVEDVDGRRPLLAAVASGSTEAVISLLMWRGNNMKVGQSKFSSGRKPSSSVPQANHSDAIAHHGLQSCPLTEAVSTGNCDMVRLLLEFGGPSVSASSVAYNVTGALRVAITIPPTLERCDIIDLLINAGADPYSCCDSAARTGSVSPPHSHLTALSIAAYNGDSEALSIMLDVSSHVLKAKREGIRNDPLIQKHYQVLESRERGAVEVSMQETLVRSLYWGWTGSQNGSDVSDRLRCCLSLYSHGAQLSDSNFFRLQQSLADDKLSAQNGDMLAASEISNHDICFEAHYRHPVYADRVGKIDKSYWCKKLAQLSWFRDDTSTTDRSNASKLYCPSIREALEMDSSSFEANGVSDDDDDDFARDLCILCVGGERLLAHPRVLSNKSEKFCAALRFATLQDDESDEDKVIQLDIDAPLHLLKLFLQHCYSGSIICGLPSEPRRLVETLLELALLADEYLCPSLCAECELRLLSPNLARCYCVNCCDRTSPISDSAERLGNGMALINCLCRVQKRGSSINTESAADIIAVGRDEGIASTGYEVRAFLPTSKHSECISLQPFAAASFNAARALLQDFGSHCHVEGLSLMMLEACLNAASTRSAKEVSSLLFTGASGTKRRTEKEKNGKGQR